MSIFNSDQLRKLKAPLDARFVKDKPRSGGAKHLEGWYVAAQASEIFGHGMWDRELLRLELVDVTEVVDKDSGELTGKFNVSYLATVRVTVRSESGGSSSHTGTALGIASNRTLSDGHEQAVKAAETIAMKRALAFGFGNQFGLALYGDQNNVVDPVAYNATKINLETELGVECAEVEDLGMLVERVKMLQKMKANRPEGTVMGGEEAQASVDQMDMDSSSSPGRN